MDKKTLRSMALERRNAISPENREKWSLTIQQKVRNSPEYQEADMILSYASFRSEVETDKLNQWILEDGKFLYLPKTYADEKRMVFYEVKEIPSLVSGYQGILEPKENNPQTMTTKKVLILMPGVAFDKDGNRIGYGGGYYDRYLAQYPQYPTMLLAFSVQQTEEIIAAESCDQKPDKIVTEE